MIRRYEIYNSFDTVGCSGEEFAETEQDAEAIAEEMRRQIAEKIMKWEVEDDLYQWARPNEMEVWNEAYEMCELPCGNHADKYTKEAAEFVAQQAVCIKKLENEKD